MSVALILKAKGARVETTRSEVGLYSVVGNLKVKGIGAQVVSEDGTTVLGLISERDSSGLTEHGTRLLTLPVSELNDRDSIRAVMARMTRYRVRHLPVAEGGSSAGS
jgi:CBS domain-containing protein